MRKPLYLSDRDKVINRTFKMYINLGLFTQDQHHDFCRYAKGKSEAELLRRLHEPTY